ncbi:hypothetical protein Pla52o_35370 [Novipirellula galeiformis]|uniref:Uncharacterized protein n=1 Tax=Novipirellula galeiformis TaxID=2528004 RepID=A0A5C6CGS5_9BACT|nr:hypothetical protein [Novipirellula galeiformis]TWU22481.1 hypothetical protein Pla52o_35370 [Novipirellula galeiformis]
MSDSIPELGSDRFYPDGWDDDIMSDYDYKHEDGCNCDECQEDRLIDDCGRLPDHLGGGCSMAGSEHCDWDCPLRAEVFGENKNE